MAYADLNERAVVALYARFQVQLNGIIDQVNANTVANPTRNQTAISYPAAILDAPPAQHQLINFPIYAIADGEMMFTDDVGFAATGEYDLYAIVYDADPDPSTLAWKLRRDLQAVTTVATLQRNMDGGAWGAVVRRIIPGKRVSRVDASGQAELIGWAAVCLTLKDEQTYP